MAEAQNAAPLAFRQSVFQTSMLMPSQLWERLRHARRHADLTQRDIAHAVGLTRSAVAQWEASEPEQRTKPSAEHMMVFSRLTKAPLEWLMNDGSRLDDLFKALAETDEPDRLPDVLPDVRQGNQVFCFAQTPEQVAAKLAQLSSEDEKLERHLVLISADVAVTQVSTLAEALTHVGARLERGARKTTKRG